MPINVGKGAEYLVKLGVNIDKGGVAELQKVFDLMNKKSVQLNVALAAIGTALYKFVKECTKYELELVEMAKKQNKATKEVRASENALKAMGKTMDEVKKNKALNEVYKDIVKVNKGLSLPNLTRSLNVVRDLQKAWWGLRSSVQYVVQWINAHILANLERPLKKVTDALKGIRQWINENMNIISEKVASFLTAFAKSLLKIFEIGGKIVKWFNTLPDIVKKIGGGITMLFAIIKAGPLGWLLGIVNLIGAAIDDYENFVENKSEKKDFLKSGGGYDSLIGQYLTPGQSREDLYGQITGAFDLYEKNGKTTDGLSDRQKKLYDAFKGTNLYASTSLDQFWDPISDESLDFTGKAVIVTDKITAMLSQAFDGVAKWIAGEGSSILFGQDGTSGIIGAAASFISSIATAITSAYEKNKDKIDNAWKTIWEGPVKSYYGLSPDGKSSGLNSARSGGLKDMLSNFFTGIWETIKAQFQDGGFIAEGIKVIGGFLDEVWNGAVTGDGTDRSGGLREKLKKIIDDVWLGAQTDGERSGGLKDWLTETWDNLFKDDGLFATIGAKLGTWLNDLWLGAEKDGKRSGGLKSLLFGEQGEQDGGVWGAIKSGFLSLVSWLGENAALLLNAITPTLDAIADYLYSVLYNIVGGEFLGWQSPEDRKNKTSLKNDPVYFDKNGNPVSQREVDNSENPDAYHTASTPEEQAKVDFVKTATQNENGWMFKEWGENGEGYGTNALDASGGQSYNQKQEETAQVVTKIGQLLSYQGMITEDDGASGVNRMGSVSGSGVEQGSDGSVKASGNLIMSGAKVDGEFSLNKAAGTGTFSFEGASGRGTIKLSRDSVEAILSGMGYAQGGRVSSFQYTTVGEEGPEYIIPMTKPARAKSLIKQMLTEMGSSAATDIIGELGMDGGNTTVGGSLAAGGTIGSASGITNNVNINAPVTINVSASGADGEKIGRSVYNVAERYLIKNLQGAFG